MRRERCLCGGYIEAPSLDECEGPMWLHVQSLTHQIWRGIQEGRFADSGEGPTVQRQVVDLSERAPNASAPPSIRRLA